METRTRSRPEKVLKYPKNRGPEHDQQEKYDEVFVGFHSRKELTFFIKVRKFHRNVYVKPLRVNLPYQNLIEDINLNPISTIIYIGYWFHIASAAILKRIIPINILYFIFSFPLNNLAIVPIIKERKVNLNELGMVRESSIPQRIVRSIKLITRVKKGKTRNLQPVQYDFLSSLYIKSIIFFEKYAAIIIQNTNAAIIIIQTITNPSAYHAI